MTAPAYIGASSPTQYVKIRKGYFKRNWAAFPSPHGEPLHFNVGSSEGAHANPHYDKPWQAVWTPTTAYVELPNLREVKLSKELKSNGIEVATVEIENIVYTGITGLGKTAHREERGYLAPLRGVTPEGREALLDEWGVPLSTNAWKELLEYQVQLTIWQGFGTASKRFTGLLEDVDLTSRPDRITLTARSFGQVFSDEFFFNENGGRCPMDPEVGTHSVVFMDRLEASRLRDEAYNPHAGPVVEEKENEEAPTYAKGKAIDFHENTEWRSRGTESAETIGWIEFAVRNGKYTFLDLEVPSGYQGMEMWISMRPKKPTGETYPKREAEALKEGEIPGLDEGGWVDLGKGSVPEGGPPWTFHIAEVGGEEGAYNGFYSGPPLEAGPHHYYVGDNTVIRLSFRKGPLVAGKHHVAVAEAHAKRESVPEESEAAKQGWVLVDDISDIVRCLCCWMGFQDWEIEDAGVKLPKRLNYQSSETPMDVIKALETGIGFSFFLKDPKAAASEGGESEADVKSIGVPTWRLSRIVAPEAVVATIRDTELLTAIDVRQSTEPLASLIVCYGLTKTVPGDVARGILGTVINGEFVPPWTGTFEAGYADDRLAGVRKYASHHDPLLATIGDLQFACYFIGLQQALEAMQATIDFPGQPAIDLDEHIALLDVGTGLTTRLSVEGRNSTFTSGERSNYSMQLTGALIDTKNIAAMVGIINNPATGAFIGREGVRSVASTPSKGGYE